MDIDLLASWTLEYDGWIIVIGILCATSSALLGNFLVLRKMSMMGDAVTHAVLPGIAVAFLLSHSRNSIPMLVGAVLAGVFTSFFTEWIRRVGQVDEGASMGVVFTSLFALGLVILVQAADQVHLDPDCVLHGAIEYAPNDTLELLGKEIPRAVAVLSCVLIMNGLYVVLFFKELKISSFDPSLSTTMGFSARLMHYSLMVLVSITAVASFESVGSILVVAMLIVPGAAAYMLCDRLGSMITLSLVIATATAVLGHFLATYVPNWMGYKSTSTAGMMAVAAGLLFLVAACFGPKHGVLVKWVRRQLLSMRILCDDVVALLYRREEKKLSNATMEDLESDLFASRWALGIAVFRLKRLGQITDSEFLTLTDLGRGRGRELIRSHRLWEQYLVTETGAGAHQIHDKAEKFEHFTDRPLRDRLTDVTDGPEQDPHGKPIPGENEGS